MKLLDETKFLAELKPFYRYCCRTCGIPMVHRRDIKLVLSKHLQDIKDEPQHPSGLNHDKIKIRNTLRRELRGEYEW